MTKDECLDIIKQNDALHRFNSFLDQFDLYKDRSNRIWVGDNKVMVLINGKDLFVRNESLKSLNITKEDLTDYIIISMDGTPGWDNWSGIITQERIKIKSGRK